MIRALHSSWKQAFMPTKPHLSPLLATACLLLVLPGHGPRPATAQSQANERLVNLAAIPVGVSQVLGAPIKEQLGNDLSAADLNDDGLIDLFAGAHWWTSGGRNIIGRAYGIFGRAQWPATVDHANQRDWSFTGRGLEARLGNAVAVGDLSGDGIADAVMGSLLADPLDPADTTAPFRLLNNAGAVYVVFGGKSAGGDIDFIDDEPDVYLAGNSLPAGSDQLGTGLTVADFNGDGHPDLAVAAVLRGGFRGAVFGWWGPLAKGRRVFLSQTAADWTIEGVATRTYFGAALVAGDLSGDGVDDLIVSAVDDDGTVGGRGPVFVFRGGPQFGKPARRSAADADTPLLPAPGVSLGSALSLGGCSCKGQVMATGDLTGDAAPDLLVGAPLVDRLSGEVLLVAGPLPTGIIDLTASARLSIRAAADDGRLGWSVAIGHLDADGRPDLVLAAPWADVAGRADTGLLLGIRGPLPAEGELRLDPGQVALLVQGPQPQSGLAGISVSLADTNGDGAQDLHLGFPDAAPLNRRSVGALYRVPGPLLPSAGPSVTPSPEATPLPSSTATPEPEPSTATVPPSPAPSPSHSPSPSPSQPPSPTADSTAPAEPTFTAVASPTLAPSGTASPEPSTTPDPGRRRIWLPVLLSARRR